MAKPKHQNAYSSESLIKYFPLVRMVTELWPRASEEGQLEIAQLLAARSELVCPFKTKGGTNGR